MQMNPWLMATSATFVVPYVAAARVGAPMLAASSLALALVSSLYHATKDPVLFWVDQIAVFFLAAATLIHGYRYNTIIISCTFIGLNMVLYYIGWYLTHLVWSHDFMVATTSHAFMHLWTIFGVCILIYASRACSAA